MACAPLNQLRDEEPEAERFFIKFAEDRHHLFEYKLRAIKNLGCCGGKSAELALDGIIRNSYKHSAREDFAQLCETSLGLIRQRSISTSPKMTGPCMMNASRQLSTWAGMAGKPAAKALQGLLDNEASFMNLDYVDWKKKAKEMERTCRLALNQIQSRLQQAD
jgi:hypothetical protein